MSITRRRFVVGVMDESEVEDLLTDHERESSLLKWLYNTLGDPLSYAGGIRAPIGPDTGSRLTSVVVDVAAGHDSANVVGLIHQAVSFAFDQPVAVFVAVLLVENEGGRSQLVQPLAGHDRPVEDDRAS